MSKEKKEVIYRCEDCEHTGPLSEFKDADPDTLLQRMSCGDIFTDIECAHCGALAHPYEKPLKEMAILKWLATGEADCRETVLVNDVFEIAGRRMEKAYTSQIMGSIVFQAEDGKYYAGDVVFQIGEAADWEVQDALKAIGEEQGACILPPEKMATEDDCTTHEHETPAEPAFYDVITMRRSDRTVAAIPGQHLRLEGDDQCARRRKAAVQMNWDATGYVVFIVAADRFKVGDGVPDDFISYA